MAIRLDYLSKVVIGDAGTETLYVDMLLEGWARWARDEYGPAKPTPAGNVLHVISVLEGRYELRMTDDEFTLVDGRVAVLPGRLREIVELEYRGYWHGRRMLLSQEQKWHIIGLRRTPYKDRLRGAQWSLFSTLMPAIEQWLQHHQARKRDATELQTAGR
jgi:hypothetical protein